MVLFKLFSLFYCFICISCFLHCGELQIISHLSIWGYLLTGQSIWALRSKLFNFAHCSPNKTHSDGIQACALAMFLPGNRDWSIACIALNLACLMDIEIPGGGCGMGSAWKIPESADLPQIAKFSLVDIICLFCISICRHVGYT